MPEIEAQLAQRVAALNKVRAAWGGALSPWGEGEELRKGGAWNLEGLKTNSLNSDGKGRAWDLERDVT